MRAVPAGIELQRVRGEDAPRVRALMLQGLNSYREWAPDWSPQPPTQEVRERISGLYDDDDKAWALMALANGEVVGLVSLSVTTAAEASVPEDAVFLWQMFVRSDLQGAGLAGALMDLVLEEARSRGFKRMLLWAAEGAERARRFYEKEGWTLTGERDEGSSFGLPLVQYGRDLSH